MQRQIERDLAASLTALSGYRQARWRAVILYGLAGIGKTAMARALADDDHVKKAFRDGIAWVDGSRDPEEEVMRLCLGFDLERKPGEGWIECWRRWISVAERRLLLLVDDVLAAEILLSLIPGLGPQAVALITTQQGAEIRAEVERWLPADAVTEVGIHEFRQDEGKKLVESVVERQLSEPEWDLIRAIGEMVGWHPEALRLAAIEGREIGWEGMLGELRAGRMPWDGVRQLVAAQWRELDAEQREWLAGLLAGDVAGAWRTVGAAAALWGVEEAVARRRLWVLAGTGLVEEEGGGEAWRWRVAPVVRLALGGDGQGGAG